ncbi:MAG TPA: type I 3-dehydroquinate dehydratase [Planctomycetota bacterium]|nr:type I 3-dehydroquinate dehydratase [Planctomycetota bacterium]
MTHPILSITSFDAAPFDDVLVALRNNPDLWVELRLDHLASEDEAAQAATIAKQFGPRCLVTCRLHAEGGAAAMPHSERIQRLLLPAMVGAQWIDWELAAEPFLDDLQEALGSVIEHPTRLILSSHDFERCPPAEVLHNRIAAMWVMGATVAKIAVTPKTAAEALMLLRVQKEAAAEAPEGRSALVLGMGEVGRITRLAAPLVNAWGTFVAWNGQATSAPGQVGWQEALNLYRLHQVQPGWPLLGVIGHPISHSLSPKMHANFYRALGINALYIPIDVPENPAEFVTGLRDLDIGLKGLSVTVPHKLDVLKASGAIDPLAQSIGAANTLAVESGPGGKSIFHAFNTDAYGLCEAVKDGAATVLPKTGKRIAVVLGAGGAGRGAVAGLKNDGWDVYILNRTRAKAEALAKELGVQVTGEAALAELKPHLIVNSTSAGMAPQEAETPLDAKFLPPHCVIFDMVYKPAQTRFIREARAKGLLALEGWRMLVHQGIKQHQLWFGGRQTARELFDIACGPADNPLFPPR